MNRNCSAVNVIDLSTYWRTDVDRVQRIEYLFVIVVIPSAPMWRQRGLMKSGTYIRAHSQVAKYVN